MSRLITALFVFTLFVVGIVFLQVFLSKKENKWLGRILPIIFLLLSLIYPWNMVYPPDGVTFGYVLLMVQVLLIANIPTFALGAIYFACREKMKKSKQIDKINIQDLS